MAKMSLGTMIHPITMTRELETLTPDRICSLQQPGKIVKMLPRVNSVYFYIYCCFDFKNNNN